jgi:hypothetical protein
VLVAGTAEDLDDLAAPGRSPADLMDHDHVAGPRTGSGVDGLSRHEAIETRRGSPAIGSSPGGGRAEFTDVSGASLGDR